MDSGPQVVVPGVVPIRLLGSGGFGQVWLADQTDLDRRVALKIGHRPFATDDDRRRFERECLALGRLSGHPHIVGVHTSGVDNGVPYLVLEFIDGGTLADHVGTLDESTLRRLARELTSAVAAAHRIGVLHRDLKPENVFLRTDGAAVLGDFGIARVDDAMVTSAPGITASLAYAAPEILNGSPPSEAADVYGIGITVVTAALGKSPFLGPHESTPEAIIGAVLRGADLDLQARGLSQGFARLLQQTMHPDPNQRPASAAALADALTQLDQFDDTGSPARYVQPAMGSASQGDASLATRTTDAPAPAPIGHGRPPLGPDARPRVDPRLVITVAAAVIAVLLGAGAALLLWPSDARETVETAAAEEPGVTAGAAAEEPGVTAGAAAPSTTPTSDTSAPADTASTEPGIAPPPLALPLAASDISALTDVPFDEQGLDEILTPANANVYCGARADLTGLRDTVAAVYPADPFITDTLIQVSQRMHRFDTADQAADFVVSYTELPCSVWEDDTITTAGTATIEAAPGEGLVWADETRRVDQTVTVPGGLQFYSRVVLVRSGSDVLKIYYSSTDQAETPEKAEALTAAALELLGY